MSEKNKHTDPLESFFRKGVEQSNFEFVEEDWAKMEEMLDEVQPVVPFSWWRSSRFWVPAVLLIAAFSALYLWRAGAPVSTTKENTSASMVDEIAGNKPGQRGMETQIPVEGGSIPASGADTSNRQQSVDPTNSDDVSHSKLYGQEQTRAGGASALNNADDAAAGEVKDAAKGRGESEAAPARFVLDKATPTDNTEREFHTVVPAQALSPVAPPGDGAAVPATGSPPVYNRLPPGIHHVSKRSGHVEKGYFAVGFAASPDFSAVGFTNFGNAGSRIGMTMEYGLSRRLVVNSGFAITNNNYEAQGRDYQPPYGFWTRGVVPSETNGECRIVDIPVNLRYNIGLWSRHRLFVNAGVSSYVMLNEKYNYKYYDPDPDLIHNWESSSASVHWFGIGNASVGYEYMLTPRLSVQAEPFVKLALTGIGYGSVDLNSFGTYFSLKYHLLPR